MIVNISREYDTPQMIYTNDNEGTLSWNVTMNNMVLYGVEF
jgi:hypothetical protein